MDEEDNVPAVGGAVPHIGPIEAKLIRGSDGRVYIMEVMRLTPRDANYVPVNNIINNNINIKYISNYYNVVVITT